MMFGMPDPSSPEWSVIKSSGHTGSFRKAGRDVLLSPEQEARIREEAQNRKSEPPGPDETLKVRLTVLRLLLLFLFPGVLYLLTGLIPINPDRPYYVNFIIVAMIALLTEAAVYYVFRYFAKRQLRKNNRETGETDTGAGDE